MAAAAGWELVPNSREEEGGEREESISRKILAWLATTGKETRGRKKGWETLGCYGRERENGGATILHSRSRPSLPPRGVVLNFLSSFFLFSPSPWQCLTFMPSSPDPSANRVAPRSDPKAESGREK